MSDLEQVPADQHEGWHEITVATPLPMGVAGALMQLIGTAWPESVIRPTQRRPFGNDPVFTMLVPPTMPSDVTAERAREIRIEAASDDTGSQFTGFRVDEEDYAWVGTAPPEELTMFLGSVAHRIFNEIGGINYVEWQVRHQPEGEPPSLYTLTVTSRTGKTAHQLRQEAEAERDEIRDAFLKLYREIDGVADEMSDRDHRLIDEFWPLYERLTATATSEED
jgi:hypothetical protein